jgi:small subunit ribosomal protein S20
MANIKSQIKRNKQNAVRHERNKGVRSELKSRVKAARDAVDGKAKDADELVRIAQKRLAKAGAKGRIHKKQAARRAARLMKRAGQPAPPKKAAAKKTAAKKT